MTSTTPGTTMEASLQRLELARELAWFCPPELGQIVALTGSASRGVADEDSDAELNFWVDEEPDGATLLDWLRRAGATAVILDDEPLADGSLWATSLYKGVWFETGWQRIDAMDAIVRRLSSGEVIDHVQLAHAPMILHAAGLRDSGELEDWRDALRDYPETLQARLISSATVWALPNVIAARWALARRGERVALAERLVWDVHNVLRVLCALNHQWEPDWKWLTLTAAALEMKPDRLAERIDEIFTPPQAEYSVVRCLELIRDTLALVPPRYDIERARRTVEESLQAHAR